jgi:hypothetical protein
MRDAAEKSRPLVETIVTRTYFCRKEVCSERRKILFLFPQVSFLRLVEAANNGAASSPTDCITVNRPAL